MSPEQLSSRSQKISLKAFVDILNFESWQLQVSFPAIEF
jgi:hypothetical protein